MGVGKGVGGGLVVGMKDAVGYVRPIFEGGLKDAGIGLENGWWRRPDLHAARLRFLLEELEGAE